jgi:hypothetical protein
MNARNCLLCGKPLSRIWVGAGEDFCSREHRNQYRLRRGMDRLQEANKVANLMRRRENPKPIPTVEHSGDPEVRLADDSQVRLTASQSPVAFPGSKWSPAVRLPGACGYVRRYRKSIPAGDPRESGMPRPKDSRLILKDRLRGLDPPGANYRERIKHPRRIPAPARTGQALRVSASAGFRLPGMRSQALRVSKYTPELLWPNRPRPGALDTLDRDAPYTVPRVSFKVPEMQGPSAPLPNRAVALAARGPIAFGKRLAPCDTDSAARDCGGTWTSWPEAMPQPIRHAGELMPPPRFVALRQESMGGQPVHQLTLVPIMPEDRPFGYIPSIAVSPAGLTGVPKVSLEEQFDSGLTNWMGGVDDWVLDAAGARTGALALFIPTLDKRDYEMEFLARIDHRSVTWVFRASGLTEYHLATIASTAEGGYEFGRGTVSGGVSELAATTPLAMALNRKNAVTIRLRAMGNEFSVSLDGQPIDTWTDSRLPVGGIGFMGAPDDRARIYWVRLSPAGSAGKEYAKR